MIIAQRGCGVHEAYDVLRDTAQRLGLDRQAVAERLIAAVARKRDLDVTQLLAKILARLGNDLGRNAVDRTECVRSVPAHDV